MAKTITLTYNKKAYTLEFTRESIMRMERTGFDIQAIESQPATMITMLFRGAFIAHHSNTTNTVIDRIWEKLPSKQELVAALAEMYTEPLDALVADPEKKEGEIPWTMNE